MGFCPWTQNIFQKQRYSTSIFFIYPSIVYCRQTTILRLDKKKTVMNQVALHHASLITARRIQFCGSSKLEDISDSATTTSVTNFFARHVSASKLQHQAPPRNLRSHHTLIASDKDIWDQAYMEEYLGLHDKTKTWEYISEKTIPSHSSHYW